MRLPSKDRFAMPLLENELKRTRSLGSSAALEAIGEITSMMAAPQYRGSCVQDADECEIINDQMIYKAWNLLPNSGMTLIRAKYSKKPISGHFHSHVESIKVVSGHMWFEIAGSEITLKSDDCLTIPARSMHCCEFLDSTTLIVSIPTEVVRQLLS